MPSVAEQEKIGEYFTNLDHLITLHQRKLYHFVKRQSFAWEQRKLDDVMPSVAEQEKIGEYFTNLDHLITLHQRKLYHFVKRQSFAWEQRKLDDVANWEQRKLDDVAKFSKGAGYSKGDLIESGTPIILYGRLYTKYETIISNVDTYVDAKDGSVYSEGGEVIVPASGETAEDIARASTVDKSGVLLGGDLNIVMPNANINSAFLAISISNGNAQRELAKKAQGKSVVHIHNEEIRNLIVPFPKKVEQDTIVEYFSTLDSLITLHQRKLYHFVKRQSFAWEQRKFSEFVKNVAKKNKDNLDLEPFAVYAISGRTRKNRRVFYQP